MELKVEEEEGEGEEEEEEICCLLEGPAGMVVSGSLEFCVV